MPPTSTCLARSSTPPASPSPSGTGPTRCTASACCRTCGRAAVRPWPTATCSGTCTARWRRCTAGGKSSVRSPTTTASSTRPYRRSRRRSSNCTTSTRTLARRRTSPPLGPTSTGTSKTATSAGSNRRRSDPMNEADDRWMCRALELAERGRGFVEPNPLVGAVVVRDGAVVGAGWHETYGGPHAEVNALVAAGDAARGATLYVTLEPCCHHGKTPPCTDAILRAGVKRVVAAMPDPFPDVAGKGAERLRAAGVAV